MATIIQAKFCNVFLLNKNIEILIDISLKIVPQGPFSDISAFV